MPGLHAPARTGACKAYGEGILTPVQSRPPAADCRSHGARMPWTPTPMPSPWPRSILTAYAEGVRHHVARHDVARGVLPQPDAPSAAI